MLKISGITLTIFSLSFSALSYSQSDWYIGLSAGTSELDSVGKEFNELFNLTNLSPDASALTSFDDSDTAIKLFAGYSVNDYFNLEFGYSDLGESSFEGSLDSNDPVVGIGSLDMAIKESLDGIYFAAVGVLPLSENVSLNGRLGLYFWNYDTDLQITDPDGLLGVQGSVSGSEDGEDIFYGVGLDIGWFGVFYESYTAGIDVWDDVDVTVFGVSATYNF